MNLGKILKAALAAAPVVIAYYPQAKAAVKVAKKVIHIVKGR